MDLLKKVEVIGHRDRLAFAPRISIQMVDGTAYQGEYQGNEMEWGLDTEISRIANGSRTCLGPGSSCRP